MDFDYLRGQFPERVNTKELAEFLGITPERVQQLVSPEGVLTPSGTRDKGKGYVFHPYDAAREYMAYQRRIIASRKPKNETIEQAEERKMIAEADLKEYKAEQERVRAQALAGEIHRSEDVKAFFEGFIYEIRESVLRLPVRIAKDGFAAESQAELEEVIQRQTDAVLMELSRVRYSKQYFTNAERERLKIEREWEQSEEDDGDAEAP